MKRGQILLLTLFLLNGCHLLFGQRSKSVAPAQTLAEARKGFVTQLTRRETAREPVERPPANLFQTIQFDSPVGKLAAYLTPDPKDGQRHPAIIWITGGDCNTIGDVWTAKPAHNEQTASAYRKAGMVMMFPSLRGGNENPGVRESFLGEVDDVVAALQFLQQQPYVDPARIYLGGHSTGGTLVLLVAEMSDQFRAVFSFGPTSDISGYGPEYMPFSARNEREVRLRSPMYWLHSIRTPTFVFEGTERGNLLALLEMKNASKNPQVSFFPVQRASHFSVLAPVNQLIVEKIGRDTQPKCNLTFTQNEFDSLFKPQSK